MVSALGLIPSARFSDKDNGKASRGVLTYLTGEEVEPGRPGSWTPGPQLGCAHQTQAPLLPTAVPTVLRPVQASRGPCRAVSKAALLGSPRAPSPPGDLAAAGPRASM